SLLFEHHYRRFASRAFRDVQSRGDRNARLALETNLLDAEIRVFDLRCGGHGRSRTFRRNASEPQLREQFGNAALLLARAKLVRNDLIQLPAARFAVDVTGLRHLQLEIGVQLHRLVPRVAFAAGEPANHPAIDLFARVARRSVGSRADEEANAVPG